ncbi:MAG: hypothetical protein N2249_03600 [Melioribacter sp.]|nr:hypothetical protein [Melioribacter sp.]
MNNKKILLFLITLFFFSFIILRLFNTIQIYTFVYIFSSLLFLIIAYLIIKVNLSKWNFFLIILVCILLRISFVNTIPIGSDDIYRYMWDGKVQSNGINPYKYSPNDMNLSFLRSDILPAKVNFPDLKTIYFPLSQWLFFAGYKISGENVWGYKFLLLIFELGTLFIVWLSLKELEKPSNLILLYALCPLPIIQFALDSHLDGFGLTLLSLFLLFYLKKKLFLSLIFLGLSFSVKPVGILFVPVLLLREKLIVDKIKIILVPFVAFLIQFIPYIFTSNPFESLFIYAKHWSFNGSIFKLLNVFINHNQTTRIVCGLILFLILMILYLSKLDYIKKFYYSVLLLLIFSPVVHPWYVSWLTILLPFVPAWSGLTYSSLSSLTSFTILNYQTLGVWKDYTWVLLIEYIPVFVFLFYEIGFIKKPFFKLWEKL